MSSSSSKAEARAEALSRIRKAPVKYLPIPWGPPIERPYTQADSELPYLSEPRQSLDRSQLPYTFRPWRPGVVHCGYLVNRELFFDYAATHGLTYYKILDGHVKERSTVFTVTNCLKHMCRELKIACPRLAHVIRLRGTDLLISFTNNYELYKCPPRSDMRKLKQALGESEEPMWYLEHMNWRWEYRSRRT